MAGGASYPLPNAPRRARVAVLAVLVLVGGLYSADFFAPRFLRPAGAHSGSWALEAEAGQRSSDAEELGEHNCDGVTGIPTGTAPAWVRVGASPEPDTPFVKASGQILRPPRRFVPNASNAAYRYKTNSFVNHTDNPGNHYSKDLNVFLTPDAGSRHLMANGNFHEGDENELGAMEVEWERGGIPLFAFPALGDRLTVWGTHIWDCGHGDSWANDDKDYYRTEIHPPVGWVVYRNTADRNGLPDDEVKRTSEWRWYGPDDLPGAVATFPDSALGNTPVPATVADAFFSTFGGNTVESLNGCDDLETSCREQVPGRFANEWGQKLLNEDYAFFVPAPPRPSPDATMLVASEDLCGTVPQSPGNPPYEDVERVGEADDSAKDIGAPLCLGDAHDTVEPATEGGREGVRVTLRARSSGVAYPPNFYVAYATRWKVGWDHVPADAARPRRYRVEVRDLHVYDDAEPCGEDGEWVMSLRVNEQWRHPVRGYAGAGTSPIWTDGAVDDDKCDPTEDPSFQSYFLGEHFDVDVPANQDIRVWERSYEVDTMDGGGIPPLPQPDVLPIVDVEVDQPVGGSSSHVVGETAHSVEGAHQIGFTVTDITPPPPTPGTLAFAGPTYGPNDDTTGRTRITGTTRAHLSGTDAPALQYRAAPVGVSLGGPWARGDGLDVPVAALPEGPVTIEYAPVSASGIVGERRRVTVEVDRTPPTISHPPSVAAAATSAQGAAVAFDVSGRDALPGPVELSCEPRSGSLFPVGTSTVGCGATDRLGNRAQASFPVVVSSPFGGVGDFVALGREWVVVGDDVSVESGNVGAFDAGDGPARSPGVEVVLGARDRMGEGGRVAGDTVQLGPGVVAGQVFRADRVIADPTATFTERPGYVPLFLTLPAPPAAGPGGADVSVKTPGTVLGPGDYGEVEVFPNQVLTLAGGTYTFRSIVLRPGAALEAVSPVMVTVTGRVDLANDSRLGPAVGSPSTGADVLVHVLGADDARTGQAALRTGTRVALRATLHVPAGTADVGTRNQVSGAVVARRLQVGEGTVLKLASAFAR